MFVWVVVWVGRCEITELRSIQFTEVTRAPPHTHTRQPSITMPALQGGRPRGASLASDPTIFCLHFQRGSCRYGSECAFRHERVVASASDEAHTRTRTRPKKGGRFASLRQFLVDTYGMEVLRSGSGVVDIAGGQGMLSWELVNKLGIPVTVVDPRPCSEPPKRFERRWTHLQKHAGVANEASQASEAIGAPIQSPDFWRTYWRDELWRPLVNAGLASTGSDELPLPQDLADRLAQALDETPTSTNSARRTRKQSEAGTNTHPSMASASRSNAVLPTAAEACRVLRDCSVVVGMHPDAATESAVDFAIATGKPFAVVPCCVCAVDFPQRSHVRSHAAFVEYLRSKDPQRIGIQELPFEGKNIVVFSLPSSSEPQQKSHPQLDKPMCQDVMDARVDIGTSACSVETVQEIDDVIGSCEPCEPG